MFVGTNSANIFAKRLVGKFRCASEGSTVPRAGGVGWGGGGGGVPASETLIHTSNIEPAPQVPVIILKKKKKALN